MTPEDTNLVFVFPGSSPCGVCFSRLAQKAQAVLALFAKPLLASVAGIAAANAHATAAGRAVEQDVGDIDRHFLGEPAALGILPAGLEVLVNPIDAFHHDLILLGQRAQDPAGGASLGSAGVVACYDLDYVVFMYVHGSPAQTT